MTNTHAPGWHSSRWHKKHPEANRHEPSKPNPKDSEVTPRGWWIRVGAWGWGGIVTVSMLLAYLGILDFRADVSFTRNVRLDPNDPFSTLFTVTNESAFAIEDVRFACHMNYVEMTNYMLGVRDQEGSTDPREESEIQAHKSQDVACLMGAMGVPVRPPPNGPAVIYGFADITVCASFRPQFWRRRAQWERFIARTDGHGKIVEWSHQAGGKNCLLTP